MTAVSGIPNKTSGLEVKLYLHSIPGARVCPWEKYEARYKGSFGMRINALYRCAVATRQVEKARSTHYIDVHR
jgi:hypothetical protein